MLLAKSANNGAKPETLLEHTQNVLAMARALFNRLPISLRTNDESLLSDLEAAALVHDLGKAAVGFQEMLQAKRANWNGWRHELLSAGFASNLGLAEEAILAVLTHHRQIPGSQFDGSSNRLNWSGNVPESWFSMLKEWRVNQSEATELWSRLCVEANREDLKTGQDKPLNAINLDPAWLDRLTVRKQTKFIPPTKRVRASLLRGLLMGADHLASAGIIDIPEPIKFSAFSPKFKPRGFQRACQTKGNVILDAPTGSGKTEAALFWAAANQAENGRLFYTLPYTAALNAMHSRLQREFPEGKRSIGLLHGKAAHHLYKAAQEDYPANPQQATADALARAKLARETYFPVRVCTPHQLLRFTLRGRGWEQMLSEIPGSCIVFDEVHSYDANLAGLTLGTAKLFASMGANLMFISATLPTFMRANISQLATMIPISPKIEDEDDRKVIERRRHIVTLHDGSLLDMIGRILAATDAGRRTLVVCNHVSSAQQVARTLRRRLGESEEAVCLFHGRFNMKDRKAKEAKLASDQLPKVLVATQVVEVSLDISFDLGFFEAAPIDALVQRMGRVNRQGDTPAPIVILRTPLSSHRIYDSQRTLNTLELLSMRTDPLSEADLTSICNKVYRDGYVGDEKRVFEQRLNHRFLTQFEREVVAGEHYEWIDKVIENEDGRADVLPIGLQSEYYAMIAAKRWLDADALLVNAYTAGLGDRLDRTNDPWTVDLSYDREGLGSPKSG